MKTSLISGTAATARKQCSMMGWPATGNSGWGGGSVMVGESGAQRALDGRSSGLTHLGQLHGQRPEACAAGRPSDLRV